MSVARIVNTGARIYDAVKKGKIKRTPVKTENQIADEAYELGVEFAKRVSSGKPMTKMSEGGTITQLNEGGMISPFMDNTNLIKSINENLQKKGVPAVDLRVQEQSISNFLKDDGMASKMYAITSGELSIDELKPLQQNMLNNLIAVSQYESSLGTADKDDYGVIKHSNANTVGMFGLQEGTVKTLHDNGTLDRSITWDKISTDPVLANSVGALNVLQIDARAFNRTGSYPTPAQSLTMNRSGIDGTLVDNKYDIDYAMKNWRPEEIQNYNDTITFLNEIGINK